MSDGMTDRRSENDTPRRHTIPIPAVPAEASPRDHMTHLKVTAMDDVAGLEIAEAQYGSSWKRRGGVGAFMMLARKWDRIEQALSPRSETLPQAKCSPKAGDTVPAYDIFRAIAADDRSEGIIDDIRDLRRYLLLVESEMKARGFAHAKHRDNV
jgi:hypothetical protein